MTMKLSRPVQARRHRSGGIFAVNTIDLSQLDGMAAPLSLLDDFLVSGQPFGPHPHAGFSAITYVLEDSAVALRSRDSLGNDLTVRPGGIVWLQAGRGAQHQEVPAVRGGEMHGAQIYVNLSARNKMAPPKTMYLQPEDVPEWKSEAGDRIRVLVGRFHNLASAIEPVEPYVLLDAHLVSAVDVPLNTGDNTVFYVLSGEVEVIAEDATRHLPALTAVAMAGADKVRLRSSNGKAQVLVLSGRALNEPVVASGPFIMNDNAGIQAAIQRYHAGQMGDLAPV